jgi:hypothetical protein
MYWDWHQRDGATYQWFRLLEVYASLVVGRTLWLSGPSTLIWELRLRCEVGVLHPVSATASILPPDAPMGVHRLYEGFLLLPGVKWLHNPQVPTAFAWRFAADRYGMGERQVGKATHWLLNMAICARSVHIAGWHCFSPIVGQGEPFWRGNRGPDLVTGVRRGRLSPP